MGVACVTYGQEFIWGKLDDRPYEALWVSGRGKARRQTV
jgi:hypothetical protein